ATLACGAGSVLTAPVATCTISSLAVGTASLTAVYAGAGSFLGSTSAALAQVVNRPSTTTTLAASSTSLRLGAPLTLTAAIAVVAPATGSPTGSVTFMDGVTALSGSVAMSAGVATF